MNDFNPPLTCTDLRDQEGFPGCCDSCHDDRDEYGIYDQFEVYVHDGTEYSTCCRVRRWLEGDE